MKESNLTKVMGKAWKVAAPTDSGLCDSKAQVFPGVMEIFSLGFVNISSKYCWLFEIELVYMTEPTYKGQVKFVLL